MQNDNKEQREKLLLLVRDAVQQDQKLREQYQIGDKFRFIRDRLTTLLMQVEEGLMSLQEESEKSNKTLGEDEIYVYVYLYNAQGITLKTWQKMLTPSVFYEYSVNRPIYINKAEIEALVRGKANKVQHGFLTVIIKKQDVLSDQTKDAMGHSLVKVKEGSLHFDRFVSFTHNGQDYVLNEVGEIVMKPQ